MRLKIVVWCSWHRNLSYSLTQSASKSVDKYNEQCLPQANSLRTKPAFSSEHRGPSQPSQFHFLSSFPSWAFSACPEVYCFWSLERRSSPSPGGLGTCRQPLIPLFSQHPTMEPSPSCVDQSGQQDLWWQQGLDSEHIAYGANLTLQSYMGRVRIV